MNTRTRIAAAACGMLLSTAALSANDPVLEWNEIMVNTTAGENPVTQARFATRLSATSNYSTTPSDR
jgi:hypothetical protein